MLHVQPDPPIGYLTRLPSHQHDHLWPHPIQQLGDVRAGAVQEPPVRDTVAAVKAQATVTDVYGIARKSGDG